jgi:PKD repeat protein
MAAGKRAGRRSQQQNDFLQPQAPVNVVATDVGTNRAFNNGAASVAFSLPSGSAAATSFTVTATAAGQTTRTATGSSSPIAVESLASAVTYTVSVTATNASGTSGASSTTTVTATTVPATMSAPTATAGVNKDTLAWTAPSTGGKAISTYRWTSSDSKTGTTTATSGVEVTQEANTAQTYQVRAENANGVGVYSASSNSVTTQAPFFPPYFPFFPGFGPYFPGFTPYFPFFPGFAPYFPGFTPPPFFPGFSIFFYSIGAGTMVLTPTGYKEVSTVAVGDKLVSLNIEELEDGMTDAQMLAWQSENFTNLGTVETEITSVVERTLVTDLYQINSDWFTSSHDVLVRKDGIYRFLPARDVDDTYEIFRHSDQTWHLIESVNSITGEEQTIYTIETEPYNVFFTQDALVFDRRDI